MDSWDVDWDTWSVDHGFVAVHEFWEDCGLPRSWDCRPPWRWFVPWEVRPRPHLWTWIKLVYIRPFHRKINSHAKENPRHILKTQVSFRLKIFQFRSKLGNRSNPERVQGQKEIVSVKFVEISNPEIGNNETTYFFDLKSKLIERFVIGLSTPFRYLRFIINYCRAILKTIWVYIVWRGFGTQIRSGYLRQSMKRKRAS